MSDRHGPLSIAAAQAPLSSPRASALRAWQLGLAALALAVVSACGGGGGGDGVGSNGTGVSSGTVYGFGSVIVDGVRFDDSDALVQVLEGPDASEAPVLTEVKLGHRTLIEASGVIDENGGKATRIEVEPTLIGVVEAGGINGQGQFTVLGQTVQIVPASTVQSATLLIDTPAVGDLVEVHATRSGSGASLRYSATRIEKRVAPAARTDFIRLTGITENASTSSFNIGGVRVNYTGSPVGSGQLVTVFAGSDGYNAAGKVLTARAVRVRALVSAVNRDDYEGGVIGSVSGNELQIDGLRVNVANAEKKPSDYVAAVGDYVRVKGRFSGGVFVATELRNRRGDVDSLAELTGSIARLQKNGSIITGFSVRDTAVTVTAGTTTLSGDCANATNGTFVEVKGRVIASGLQATRVDCKSLETVGAVVERKGYVKNLNTTANTFDVVATLGGTDTVARVRYQPDRTYFRSIDRTDPNSWKDGILVEVEGPLSSDPAAAVASFDKTTKVKLETESP
ncbi:DUF5666 domain-containing protein [Leptothrix discophora]|uniref:DUF5666 domain-containing protein n=1 Tax=Leptothrix discophora TaxID=89 RepID=A0ABT9FYA6_LEPDI|nr:DUF5666 domain-containing protein [Leptothrix discophora]MDP4299225.1 DUF5666 domain-containing protein [Leptothrix discophora]